MAQVKNSGLNNQPNDAAVNFPHTPEEDFVARIYHQVDKAAAGELFSLRSKNGIHPTCQLGCYECCNQYILINRAEAHALGQFIRREFSAPEMCALELRTRQWHAWNEDRRERLPAKSPMAKPYCPLLVDGTCQAYAMRPLTCRTHFVCSSASFCRFSSERAGARSRPTTMTSVLTATTRFSDRLKHPVNNSHPDFSRETMLLPHWLAIEMKWEFAVAI